MTKNSNIDHVNVRSGRLKVGVDCQFGDNVTINVAEECTIGDRCVIADNTWIEGRIVKIGDDFFGYDWGHPLNYARTLSRQVHGGWLEIGRGRRDEEDAIFMVGDRCTFHDNRIDLARRVIIGSDVGLSPEVTIYTHGYWESPLRGFPFEYNPVEIQDRVIVGYRSTLLPGAVVAHDNVVGAGAVVTDYLPSWGIYGGVPAKLIRQVMPNRVGHKILHSILTEWTRSMEYRGYGKDVFVVDNGNYPKLRWRGVVIDCEAGTCQGDEDELTDDLRWFLFSRGIRVYTKRRFRKLPMKGTANLP